jgi:hypothetical protein
MSLMKTMIKKFKSEEYANKPIQSNKINNFFKIVKDDKNDMKKHHISLMQIFV